jgi:hypothetical protein
MTLIYDDLVKENKDAFLTKVQTVAASLGIDANWLMGVMYIESKLDHKAVNKYSKAVGLIQFTKRTAESLGTSADLLLQMSNIQQMDYVLKYFTPYKNKIVSFVDVYFAVFYPAAIGKYFDYVLGKIGASATLIAQQNPGLDLNKKRRSYKA